MADGVKIALIREILDAADHDQAPAARRALDDLTLEAAEAATLRVDIASLQRSWHEVPYPVLTEHGPERRVYVTWPLGRPDWTPVAPSVLESMAHTLTAYRVAEYARDRGAWWAPWRWFSRG